MKKEGHPQFNNSVVVTCACGSTFTTGSTVNKINVEICSACHPFFTGTQKLIDTEGRVDKFAKRQALASQAKTVKKAKDDEKKQKAETRTPKTLKEMLEVTQTEK